MKTRPNLSLQPPPEKPAPRAELSLMQLLPFMPPGMRSASTVMRMVRERQIPGHKPSARWYFVWREVEQALQVLDERRTAVGNLLHGRPPLAITMPVGLIDLLVTRKPRKFRTGFQRKHS